MFNFSDVDEVQADIKRCPLCNTLQTAYFFKFTNIGEICEKCWYEGKKEQVLL